MFSRVRSLFLALSKRSDLERDMADEMRFHLEKRAGDLVKSGLLEGEARRRAQLEFGGVESYKERCRESRGLRVFDELRCDLSYALRVMRKNPSFAIVAILTLAFGIGVNTALFGVIDAAVLHPIPVQDPSNLYEIVGHARERAIPSFSSREYTDLRDQSQAFQQVIAFGGARAQTSRGRLFGSLVSGNYFDSLGGRTQIGRPLLPDDARPDSEPVLVLSHAAWQRHFGSDPNIIGGRISIAGHSLAVVGVAVPNFRGLDFAAMEFWAPLSTRPFVDPRPHRASDSWLNIVGRLRRGVSPEQARAETAALLSGITQSRSDDFTLTDATLKSRATYQSWDELNGFVSVVPISIVCGLVLLIACSNLANVQLARAFSRQREIGVRLSLGASRGRIVRQLVTEGIPIAVVGAAAGLVLAHWMLALVDNLTRGLLRVSPFELTLDFRLFGFTLLLSALAIVLFGLAPALQATRPNLASVVNADGRILVLGLRRARLRDGLVVVQFALSLALLAGAGTLLVRTVNLMAVQTGIDTTNTLIVDVSANPGDRELPGRVSHRLASVPGVVSIARESDGPLGYKGGLWGTLPEAPVTLRAGDSTQSPASYDLVSAEYFNTMGLPIIRGRPFTAQEADSSASVAVVSKSTAEHFWPGENPLGKQFFITITTPENSGPRTVEVVGVARDAVNGSVYNGVAATCVYLPVPLADAGGFLVVRVNRDPGNLVASIQSALSSAEPATGFDIITLNEIRSVEILPYRLISSVATALGLLALVLASIGIYGVIAYLVNEQTRDMGVRMALGARPADVLGLMLRNGSRLIMISVGLGLVAALEFCRILGSFVANLNVADPRVFVGSTVILVVVGIFATYLPARRVAHIDPSVALRYE